MATIINNNLPPLPPGFVIGDLPVNQTAQAPQAASPELPPGFVVEEAPAAESPAPDTFSPEAAAQRRQELGETITDIGKGALAGVARLPLGLQQLAAQGATTLFPESEIASDLEFATRRAEMRRSALAEEAKERSPIAGTIAELAPQIGQLAPIGAAVRTLPGVAGVGAGIAAGEAALRPTVEERTPGEFGREVATAAALGGAAGPAAIGAGRAIGGIGRLITGRSADDILRRRIGDEQVTKTLTDLQKSDIAILPDVAGDEIQGLTRAVGRLPVAKNIVSDALEGRSEQATKRITQALSRDISNVDSYFASLDDMAKARASVAQPLYAKAFKETPNIDTPRINELIGDERIQRAMNTARRTFGVAADVPNNSLQMLDDTKKVLDDTIGKAVRAGENQRARAFTLLKNDLVKEIERVNPTYKEARRVFSDFTSLQDAQEAGLNFTKQTPEQLKQAMKLLDPSQREAFRIGVRENLQRTVSRTADQADPAKRIFGKELQREQLRAVFGDGDNFNRFARKMREEIAAAKTKFRVLAGSRTDINLSDDGEFIESVGTIARTQGLVGQIDLALGAVIKAAKNRYTGLTQKNARELAEILVNREAGIDALIRLAGQQTEESQRLLLRSAIRDLTPTLSGVGAAEVVAE